MIKVTIALKTATESNTNETLWSKAARAKKQKSAAYYAVMGALGFRDMREHVDLGGAVRVMVTRIAPRKLDRDNAWSSQKHVIDGVAYALGIDDGDARFDLTVDQRKGSIASPLGVSPGVEILVEPKEA